MRFILSALLVLTLAACASQGPTANSPTTATNPATQQAVADALRKTATAKETINVDQGSVTQLTSSDTDLWARIRRGYQMPDLQTDLVDMQVNWYAQRPDYVQRMTERSHAAVDRIRVQPAGAVGREGGRHVAVHAGHRPYL